MSVTGDNIIEYCFKRQEIYNEALNNKYLEKAFEGNKDSLDFFVVLTNCSCVFLSTLSNVIEQLKKLPKNDNISNSKMFRNKKYFAKKFIENFYNNFEKEFDINGKFKNNSSLQDIRDYIENFYGYFINPKNLKNYNMITINSISRKLLLTNIYENAIKMLKKDFYEYNNILDKLKAETYELYVRIFQDKFIEEKYKLNSSNINDVKKKNVTFNYFAVKDTSGKTPYSFLSYAHKDKLFTLHLFLKFKYNFHEILYVDWLNHGIEDDGKKLKEYLYKAINNSQNFYLLRTPHVEITGKDSDPTNLRQWCAWEVGCFYSSFYSSSQNKRKIVLINTIDKPKKSQFYEGYLSRP